MASPPRDPDPDTTAAPSPRERARARGRRVAFGLFYTVAAGISLAGAVQIFSQAFARREAPEVHIGTCDEGLSRLASAVARARAAASVTDGEDAALADFRKALRPEWDDRDHIEDLCRPSASSMAMLDAIEQLRYAEEHAVRREAADLAPLRRRVQPIAPHDGERATVPSAPSPSSPASGNHQPP